MSSEFPSIVELAELCQLFSSHLVHGTTVKVLAATAGDDDAEGRSTLTYPELEEVATTAGRIEYRTGRELRGDQWLQVTTWTARLGVDVAVNHGDRIYDTQTNQLFEVSSVAHHHSHLGALYLKCELVQIAGGVL
jgi:hypothetical protein